MLVYYLSVWYSQLSRMVNIFGDSIGEDGQFLESLLIISMKFELLNNYGIQLTG